MTAPGSAPVSGTAAAEAVLAAHEFKSVYPASGLTFMWTCRCGEVGRDATPQFENHRAHVAAALATALDTTPTAQDTADPTDGLCTCPNGRHLPASETCDYIAVGVPARQRPTRQADTDRAVVEAVLAESADRVIKFLRFVYEGREDQRVMEVIDAAEEALTLAIPDAATTIAAASEPTSGHHHDEAEVGE